MVKNSKGKTKRRKAAAKLRDKNNLLSAPSKIKRVIQEKEKDYIQKDWDTAAIISSYNDNFKGHHVGLKHVNSTEDCFNYIIVMDSSIRMQSSDKKK